MKSEQSAQGFTLLETLVVVVLIGVVALAVVPLLTTQDPAKLDVAAAEAGNVLRFATSEAGRGSYIWVDGSVPGHLRVSRVVGPNTLAAVTDPLTKRDLDLDSWGPALSGQVGMAPRFMQGGMPYTQLLIGPGTDEVKVGGDTYPPGTTQLLVYDGTFYQGALQAGSGIVLTLGPRSATVGLNEITGLVTLP